MAGLPWAPSRRTTWRGERGGEGPQPPCSELEVAEGGRGSKVGEEGGVLGGELMKYRDKCWEEEESGGGLLGLKRSSRTSCRQYSLVL